MGQEKEEWPLEGCVACVQSEAIKRMARGAYGAYALSEEEGTLGREGALMSKKGRREACDQGQVGRWCCGGSVHQEEGHDHEGGQKRLVQGGPLESWARDRNSASETKM